MRRWSVGVRHLPYALGVVASLYVAFHGVIRDPANRYYGPGDADQNIWFGWRFSQSMRDWDIFPSRFDDMIVPVGLNLLTIDGYLPLWVMGVVNLAVEPVLAYNLVFFAIGIANFAAVAALARTVTANRWITTVAGFLAATAPGIVTRQAGHIQLYCIFVVALLMREALLTIRDERAVQPWRLTALCVVAFLCSTYFLIAGVGVFLVVMLLHRRPQWDDAGRVAIAGVATVALLSPFWVSTASLALAERAALNGAETQLRSQFFDVSTRVYSADLLDVVVPPAPTVVDVDATRLADIPFTGETLTFPGFALLAALVAGSLLRHRHRRTILVLATLVVVVSLGPILRFNGAELDWLGDNNGFLPYEVFRRLPVLDALRSPGRFGLVLPVVGAFAFAALADRWVVRARPSRRQIMFCGAALAVSIVPSLIFLASSTGIGAVVIAPIDAVGDEDDAFMVVPADCGGREVLYMHLQVVAQRPMVGCGAQFSSLPWLSELHVYEESEALASLRCVPEQLGPFIRRAGSDPSTFPADLIKLRQDFGVRFIVFDVDRLGQQDCENVRSVVADNLSDRSVLAEAGPWKVIDLDSSLVVGLDE